MTLTAEQREYLTDYAISCGADGHVDIHFAIRAALAEIDALRKRHDAIVGLLENKNVEIDALRKENADLLAALEAIVATPDHPMRKKCKDIARAAIAAAKGGDA